MESLVKEILACTKCQLWKTRTNAVPGVGSRECLMFVGEAPGANEDIEGKPFVGAAGKLLTDLIKEVLGLDRSQVYITNLVKCRPPRNREPTDLEEKTCWPYLQRELEIVRPKVIVALGRHSSSYLLGKIGVTFKTMEEARGKIHAFPILGSQVPLFSTYHPAAALYNPRLKDILVQDFRRIKTYLGGGIDKYLG